jgi:hypothetical protein
MAKIDLDAMNIDELANLRDRATEKLAEKVAARQAELEAELPTALTIRGKPVKKAQPAPPTARGKKSEKSEKNGEAEQQAKPEAEQVSEAA